MNGVDRIFYGITALEAFRDKGVILVIEYYSAIDKALDLKTIITHGKLKLIGIEDGLFIK